MAKKQEISNLITQNIQFDKAIFIQNESGGYFNNGGFFTGFSKAFKELSQNKNLGARDIKLLLLIMSYMGEKEMMITPNRQRLLTMDVYAKEMGIKSRQDVNSSFIKLEEMGYFKRDKGDKSLELMINPAMAYSGKTKEYTMVWNQLAVDFANPPRRIKAENEEGEQDWESHLIDDIRAKDANSIPKKHKMRQHNIEGGIDEIEYD